MVFINNWVGCEITYIYYSKICDTSIVINIMFIITTIVVDVGRIPFSLWATIHGKRSVCMFTYLTIEVLHLVCLLLSGNP